ncbi:MAG: hypothetical protein AAGF61_04810 [Pseudomonadota bacterium]
MSGQHDDEPRFPNTPEELNTLLASWGHDINDLSDEPLDRDDLLALLFVRAVLEIGQQTSPGIFSREYVETERARKAKSERYFLDPRVEVVERLLDQGVSPDDMNELALDSRMEVAFNVLYLLSDPGSAYPGELGDKFRIHLYAESEKGLPIENSRSAFNLLHQMVYDAMPNWGK